MRKRWVVRITKSDSSSYVWTKRYHTERSAEQALEDWQSGRGNLGYICKPEDGWSGEVIFD